MQLKFVLFLHKISFRRVDSTIEPYLPDSFRSDVLFLKYLKSKYNSPVTTNEANKK